MFMAFLRYKTFGRLSQKKSWITTTSRCRSELKARMPSAVGFNDYDLERKRFQWMVPEKFNFARDVIDTWAYKEMSGERSVNNPGLWWVDDYNKEIKWSYQQLSVFSKKVANVLQGPCGLRKGDVVITILPRLPEWWLLNIACLRAGLILSPATVLLTANDIEERLLLSQAHCIIADDEAAEKVDSVARNCPDVKSKLYIGKNSRTGWLHFDKVFSEASTEHQCLDTLSEDPMTRFFTSGTTGKPKMVQHTHASYGIGHYTTANYWLDLVPQDVHWNISDTGWAKAAWSSVYAPWLNGSCVFIHHSSTQTFDAQRSLEIFERFPVTTHCASPTVYRLLVQCNLQHFQHSNLRYCVSAGEPLNPEVTEEWFDSTGLLIREGFGQTETTLLCASFPCIPNKPGSMGKPPPGVDLQVINENCEEAKVGEEGDIAMYLKPERPVGLFKHYVNDAKRTAEAFRGDYYLPGDRAYRDEEGYFWFVARSDDVIISSGYRIGPFEVESALIEHPAVVESAAVSSPHPIRGAVVKAFVILADNYKSLPNKEKLVKELQDHVKKVTAPYKYPRKIEFVEQLPKTVSGKIRRIELRNNEWQK